MIRRMLTRVQRMERRIRSGLTAVLLVILFLGVVLPTGLARRAIGRDPLRRGLGWRGASLWQRCEQARSRDEYLRQF